MNTSSSADDSNSRLESLTTWDSDWRGLRVLVAGIGLSGFSAADTLIELGARVVVVDGSDSEENRGKSDTLKIVGAADVRLGTDAVDGLSTVDGKLPELVITSPGFRPSHPLLAAAADAGIPIWGDVELAWRVRIREGRPTAPWLAITGTNGKTTTVGMTESMLQAAGLRAIAAGNVGTPILDAIRDPQGWDAIAVELSSFQLHWTYSMSPLASV
ncbi:MAG: Mur ligase family protein, partial [Arthrobacter sp.]